MRIAIRFAFLFLAMVASVSLPWGRGYTATPSLIMSVIDVGQGDSILVQLPGGHTMLIDAADQEHGPTVVQYLRSRGVKTVDILVATHPHEDHIGGMLDVLTAFQVGKVWDSGYNQGSRTQQRFLEAIKQRGIQFGKPKAGFSQDLDGVQIAVLAPRQLLEGTDSDANNNSLVLRLSYQQVSFLLTGDMEEAERNTVAQWPRSTVLKVAHHGSRNGTDDVFLRQVAPQFAVISYAEGNEYGHPHPETLQALEAAHVKTYRTADDGTVIVSTNGSDVTAKTLGADHAVPAASTSSAACNYIGNRRTHIYHLPTANHLPKPENRVCFATRQTAEEAGYRACKICFK